MGANLMHWGLAAGTSCQQHCMQAARIEATMDASNMLVPRSRQLLAATMRASGMRRS
jgi:hypothetical protein